MDVAVPVQGWQLLDGSGNVQLPAMHDTFGLHGTAVQLSPKLAGTLQLPVSGCVV